MHRKKIIYIYMMIYLFSHIDTPVRVENKVFLLTKNNPMRIEGDISFVEFLLPSPFLPAQIYFDKKNWQKNTKVFDFYDGLLIMPMLKPSRSEGCKTILETFGEYFGHQLKLSVIQDGGYKIVLSTFDRTYQQEIPFLVKKWQIVPHSSLPLIVIILENQRKILLAVSIPDLKPLFSTVCDEVGLDEHLLAKSFHKDILKHTVTDIWKVNNPFELLSRRVEAQKKDCIFDLIPYAFLEEVALYGDYQHFLSDSLKENASLIPDFFGNYLHFIPPIDPKFPNTIALVYEKSIKYLEINVENGKIYDLNLTE